jgi:hypothetical protein
VNYHWLTEQLETFRTALEAKLKALNAAHPAQAPTIRLDIMQKYARIVTVRHGDILSAYGFVDLANGDILKAAGWKVPAKHARGNIFADDPLAACGPFGMAYLR